MSIEKFHSVPHSTHCYLKIETSSSKLHQLIRGIYPWIIRPGKSFRNNLIIWWKIKVFHEESSDNHPDEKSATATSVCPVCQVCRVAIGAHNSYMGLPNTARPTEAKFTALAGEIQELGVYRYGCWYFLIYMWYTYIYIYNIYIYACI